MKVYFWVDQPDFSEKEAEAVAAIEAWVSENNERAAFVNERADGWNLGVNMSIKSAKQLIPPLNGLYKVAKQFKCDFVVGFFAGENSDESREDVCFFGHEEGRADAFEVACYLGFD